MGRIIFNFRMSLHLLHNCQTYEGMHIFSMMNKLVSKKVKGLLQNTYHLSLQKLLIHDQNRPLKSLLLFPDAP